MVAFPVGATMMPWDSLMPAMDSQPVQPGLIAMQAIPLGNRSDLPHLLGGAVSAGKEDDTSGASASDDFYEDQDEQPASGSDPRSSRRKPESRRLNLGKIPMAPGRLTNPGMAWFNKQTCEQLQQQLSEGSDISSALEALIGHVWDLSRHPVGCRLVQSAIERSSQKQAANLASELQGHVQEAMTSPHANYVAWMQMAILRQTSSVDLGVPPFLTNLIYNVYMIYIYDI